MRRSTAFLFALVLGLGLVACGGGDDDSGGDDPTVDDQPADDQPADDTGGLDQGSDEALAAIEETVANGLVDDYGAGEVSCPIEITEGEGDYDCDATFEDGSTAVVSVSTKGGSFDITNVEKGE
jgi:hypothetical protein